MEMCKTLLGFAHFHRHRRHEPKQQNRTLHLLQKPDIFICYRHLAVLMKNIKHNSRREFLGLTGAYVAGTVAAPWLNVPPAAAQTIDTHGADLVVFNAKVYTMDNRTPRAEAFAVKAGRFVAVGRTTDIKGLIAKETQTIDARQMTIVPGFTDCHRSEERRVGKERAGPGAWQDDR